MFQFHETVQLIPPTAHDPVPVDSDMAPLIQEIWARGLRTMACCQDDGEAVEAERANSQRSELTGQRGFIDYYKGWAWLKMPFQDTLGLLSRLCEHEIFGPRTKIRWRRGSWRMHIPVTYQAETFSPASYAQIYFPKDQIAELTATLAAID